MSSPSIIIIGAGGPGLAAALRAAELGADVTVLEKDHPAAGSSGLSAGVFNINATDELNVRIRVAARRLLDVLEAEHAMPLARNGHLRLARSDDHIAMFESTIQTQQDLGVTDGSRILTVDEILELVPHLNVDDVRAGLYGPRDGHMDGPLLCSALTERARERGARLITGAAVTGHTKRRGKHTLETARGEFSADVVINAAGPWATELAALLGTHLPLVNQVHEVIKMSLPDYVDYTMPMVQEYIPGDPEACYFRMDGPGQLIGGLHTYEVVDRLGSADPDSYERSISDDTLEQVAEAVTRRLPIPELGFAKGWTGLYPLSPDGQVIVGPYNADETVIALGGFGGHGLTSGLALGPTAAEWAVKGEPEAIPDARVYLPDRTSLMETLART